ncbi:MAG: VOC family protein [Nanoarchaeota archaeon]
MDKVVHFEIPFEDKEKAMTFYKEVFGWELMDMPEMNYVIAHTSETDEFNMLKEAGSINGGMFKRSEQLKNPVIVINVDNIDESVEKIKGNGGNVLREKVQVGDMGFIAYAKDTEGNVIGIWENLKKG